MLRPLHLCLLAVVIAGVLSSPAVAQQPMTFFGEDFTSGSLPAPNSASAEAQFLSNLIGVTTEDFETVAAGTRAPLAVMFGPDTATILGGSSTQVANSSGSGQFAISGTQFLVTTASRGRFGGGTGTFELTFSSPQAAFGFYGTDIGDVGGQLRLSFDGGPPITVPHTVGSGQTNNGSTIYFGYIDASNPFTSVEFSSSTGTGDIFGFDNFTIGRADQLVNNPPAAADDVSEVQEGEQLSVSAPGVLINDNDPENGALTAVLVTPPANAASFTLNADGSYTYTPVAGFTGVDSFTYTASDGVNSSPIATVTIDVTPDPLACVDLLNAIVEAYQNLVQTTLAQQTPAIQALLDAGDVAGANALQQSTVTMLVQEGGIAAANIQSECAACMAQLTVDGNQELIPTLRSICIQLEHRIGGLQASAVSQLEHVIVPLSPPPVAFSVQRRYLLEIEFNRVRTLTATEQFLARYATVVVQHLARGRPTMANQIVNTARAVLQRTIEARVRRIQQLCDNFVAKARLWPGSHNLSNEVIAAATAAMADLAQAESHVMDRLVQTRSRVST